MKLTRVSIILIAAALMATAVGCKAASVQVGGAGQAEAQNDAERVVIMGEITETVGNMVSINLIDRPETRELTEEEIAAMRERFGEDGGQVRRNPDGENGGYNLDDMTEEERAAMRERFGESGPNGGRPDGFSGIPGMGQSYTGESKEIIIPAGAPILEVTNTDGTQTESEISLAQLKAGDIIEVTYASDGETVAKVVKQSLPRGRTRFEGNMTGDGDYQGEPQIIERFFIPEE